MKTIKTTKGTFILVEVPKGSSEFHIKKRDNGIIALSYFIETRGFIDLPAGNYELIGNPFEFSEEQWMEIVHYFKYSGLYQNYNDGNFAFKTATESGQSWLRANKIYRENPLGEKPNHYDYSDDDCQTDWTQFYIDEKEWQSAQEKVSEWVILKVI